MASAAPYWDSAPAQMWWSPTRFGCCRSRRRRDGRRGDRPALVSSPGARA